MLFLLVTSFSLAALSRISKFLFLAGTSPQYSRRTLPTGPLHLGIKQTSKVTCHTGLLTVPSASAPSTVFPVTADVVPVIPWSKTLRVSLTRLSYPTADKVSSSSWLYF